MYNQLPADIEKIINDRFDRHRCSNGMRIDIKEFVAAIITEYDTKLLDRDKKIELLMKSRHNQNEFIDKAIALLEKFIYRHDAGLLPDAFIYKEIKTFLDGK